MSRLIISSSYTFSLHSFNVEKKKGKKKKQILHLKASCTSPPAPQEAAETQSSLVLPAVHLRASWTTKTNQAELRFSSGPEPSRTLRRSSSVFIRLAFQPVGRRPPLVYALRDVVKLHRQDAAAIAPFAFPGQTPAGLRFWSWIPLMRTFPQTNDPVYGR